MKAASFRIPLLGLLAILLLPVDAQNISYETPGGLKLGFGLGSSYQSSDIKNSKGGGFDLWLGTPIYQKENAFFALDWRFRFLAGYNRAIDHRMNTDGSYPNIHLTHFNYDLELALTLNRLRERTRIVLSGFIGAGIMHGITSADLLDASNNPYDYSSVLPDRDPSEILEDLDQLMDKDFETRLLNRAAILPTAGIYLGYQFTPHFALGLEHKMNFSLSEHNSVFGMDMDDRVLTGSFLDLNHYTSVVFKWALGGGTARKGPYTVSDAGPLPAAVVYPPQVEIISPHTNPYVTGETSVKVTARVFNIARKEEISVRLNGQTLDFLFYLSLGTIEISTNLRMGGNSLEIICRNEAGSDSDDLQLIYRIPVEPLPDEPLPTEPLLMNPPSGTQVEQGFPPEVNILLPGAIQSNTYEPVAEILAEISNVESPGDISFGINGINTFDFSFDLTTSRLIAAVPLNNTLTRITIAARNRYGSSSSSRIIIRETPPAAIQPYQSRPVETRPVETRPVETRPVETRPVETRPVETRPVETRPVETRPVETRPVETRPVVVEVPCTPPVVSMNIADARTATATHRLTGRISNVSNQNQVGISVNGRPERRFQFVSSTGEISSSFSFNPGQYTIVVSASNECGSDSESRQVRVREREGNEPVEETGTDTDAGWVRINPGNASWEFCLQTPGGNYNRDDLSNPNFSYSGNASSLYIKPIAGGGTAKVNGTAFNLNPGQYYLFSGNLKVQVTSKRQGAMGQWTVYIESGIAPSTGRGNNRPGSPCESANTDRNR